MHTRNQQLRTWIAAALVTAVVAPASAQATRPDDRAGTRGAGILASEQFSTTIRPDDRGGPRGLASRTAVVPGESTSFAWGDAAIGGGFAVALVGTGMVSLIALRRRSSPKTT